MLFTLATAHGLPEGACSAGEGSCTRDHLLFQRLGPMLTRFAKPTALAETSTQRGGGEDEGREDQEERWDSPAPLDGGGEDEDGRSGVAPTVPDDREWGQAAGERSGAALAAPDDADDATRVRQFMDQEREIMDEEHRSMLKIRADFLDPDGPDVSASHNDAELRSWARRVGEDFAAGGHDAEKHRGGVREPLSSRAGPTPGSEHRADRGPDLGGDDDEDVSEGFRDEALARLVRIRRTLRRLIERQSRECPECLGRSAKELADDPDDLEDPPQEQGEPDHDRGDGSDDNGDGESVFVLPEEDGGSVYVLPSVESVAGEKEPVLGLEERDGSEEEERAGAERVLGLAAGESDEEGAGAERDDGEDEGRGEAEPDNTRIVAQESDMGGGDGDEYESEEEKDDSADN